MRFFSFLFVVLVACSSMAHSQEAISIPLHNDRWEVESQFERLSRLPAREQSAQLLALRADLQEDLWTIQYERCLNNRPELSPEQRELLTDIVGLLATGVIQRMGDTPDLQQIAPVGLRADSARQSLLQVKARAKTLFPPGPARRIFLQLGESDLQAELRALASLGMCSCSTVDDWCQMDPVGPDTYCYVPSPRCTFTQGCGWWFQEMCNGICF